MDSTTHYPDPKVLSEEALVEKWRECITENQEKLYLMLEGDGEQALGAGYRSQRLSERARKLQEELKERRNAEEVEARR